MTGISLWWSFALTSVGVFGLFLTMRKNFAGPWIGLAIQVLWIAYAVSSRQWWFLLSAFSYGAVNIYGLLRWHREKVPE